MWMPTFYLSQSQFFLCVHFCLTVELLKAFSWGRICEAHAGSVFICWPFNSSFLDLPLFSNFSFHITSFSFGGKQENEVLHDVFGFTPKRKQLPGDEHRMSVSDKVSSYHIHINVIQFHVAYTYTF